MVLVEPGAPLLDGVGVHAVALGWSCSKARPRQRRGQLIGSVSPDDLEEDTDDPDAQPLPQHGDVWYVSYGSNMSRDRLRLHRGWSRPVAPELPRCPGHLPSRRSVAVDLPGSLYFAGESPQWGGGVAFYDHDGRQGGPTAAVPT